MDSSKSYTSPLTPERLEQIKKRINSAFDKDSYTDDSEEGRDIRMMEQMFNYISMLNISLDVYEQYLQDVERNETSNFSDWAYENGFGNGVY